jgi:hypothetical protein
VQCGGARAEPRSAAGGWRSAAVCGRHHLPHQRDECRYVTRRDGKHRYVACGNGKRRYVACGNEKHRYVACRDGKYRHVAHRDRKHGD